mmetsp:Transcript_835/g.2428  ORF Transcript_835/g.2428 Transcript_835/m.2428 type:complete len:581 (-) Transcript_835:2764-4506(-)
MTMRTTTTSTTRDSRDIIFSQLSSTTTLTMCSTSSSSFSSRQRRPKKGVVVFKAVVVVVVVWLAMMMMMSASTFFVESVEAATTPVVNDRATTTTTLDNGSFGSKESTNWQSDPSYRKMAPKSLVFPGTHDSGAYFLTNTFQPGKQSPVPDWVKSVSKVAKTVGIPIEELVARWAKTQKQTVFEQLRTGARYLDLRCGWQGRGGGGGGGVSEKQARRMWHEKQMALDKKKKKIKVNGKVFSRGEVPEKDLFGDTWNGRVDGTTEDESANRRQMFAKRASFKTCAVISSGAALKGKRYGKTIDEHEVVVRLNNAPTIGYENDVGSFTTLRLTNTQYEGVREYEDETVLTKWNGNPMDLMRLGTKKTYAMNPAFRQWAQQLDDTLNNHIVTSGLLMLFLLLQKCERVSAFGFGGKELEKWYYDKRPSGKIPKSAWLNSGRGLVKYDHWNTVSTNAREEALFGAKENRTLAEQPKVKVYGKKDKRIGDMLGIGAGKMANANKKKKENRKSVAVPAADVAKKTLEEKLDGLESAEEVESDMIAGEIEDDGVARRKLLNLVSHVISRERQCMADLADLGVISIYS